MAYGKSLELSKIREKINDFKWIHKSMVFSHFEEDENGKQIPRFVGSTYYKNKK